MKYRLKYYGSLLLVMGSTVAYLLLIFAYNWYLTDDPTPQQVIAEIVARNMRWKTWGACAGGYGLLMGLGLALALFLANSVEEFFKDMYEGFLSIPNSDVFPGFRNIGLFFLFVIIVFIIGTDWQLGLRDGLEVFGVFVWVIFLVTTFILVPVFLMDVFGRRFFDWFIGYLSNTQKTSNKN